MESEPKYYTTLQYQEFIDDNDNACVRTDSNKVFAKSVKSGYSKHLSNSGPSYYKYYIRVSPGKKLYDPFPKYSFSDNKSSFVDKICKGEVTYKEVTKVVFDMYLNYLRTENNQWFNKVQREINNL